MKLFGVFGNNPPSRKAEGEGLREELLTELSIDRAVEKYGSRADMLTVMRQYNELRYAMEHTKRASVLSDRRELERLQAEATALLAKDGVTLAFVPTRFNKREDSSFAEFAARFETVAE